MRTRPLWLVMLIALIILVMLAACQTRDPVPPVVAPIPKIYSCDSQRRAGIEFDRLTEESELRQYIIDYGQLRRANRRALKLPEPNECR